MNLVGGTDAENCDDIAISSAYSRVSTSQIIFELSTNISSCTGTLLGTLTYAETTQGEQDIDSVNVAFAVSSLIDTSTTLGLVSVSSAHITIQGTNFLDATVSTYEDCFDVYCRCTSSDSKTDGSNLTFGDDNDMLSFYCDISTCEEYVYGSFEISNTTCALGVLGSLSDETVAASIVSIIDTSTTQAVFVDSNQTITITGTSFFSSDGAIYSITWVCDSDVIIDGGSNTSSISLINSTMITISDVDLSNCTDAEYTDLEIQLSYNDVTATTVAVASFVYITEDSSNQLVSGSTSLTVLGSSFVDESIVPSFEASGCNNITYDTVSFTTSSSMTVTGIDLTDCYGEMTMTLEISSSYGSTSNVVGTIALVYETDVVPQSVALTNESSITIHGVGFVADDNLFSVVFLVSSGRRRRRRTASFTKVEERENTRQLSISSSSQSMYHYDRRRMSTSYEGTIISKNTTFIIATANLENTTLDDIVTASVSINLDDVTYSVEPESASIGIMGYVSVIDTSTTQGSIASDDMSVTLSGLGFYEDMLDPPLVQFLMTCDDDDDDDDTMSFIYSSELEFDSDADDDTYVIVSGINAENCTGTIQVSQITVQSTNVSISNVSISTFVSLDNSTNTYDVSPTTDQSVTVFGFGFGCTDCYTGTLYLEDVSCAYLESSSFTRVNSTQLVLSEMNLSLCTGGGTLNLELMYNGVTADTNSISEVIHIDDFDTNYQIVPAESDLSLTLSGSGFVNNPSVTSSVVQVYSDACEFEASIEEITSTSIVLFDLNLESCAGNMSIRLNYNEQGLIDWSEVASIVEIVDTYTTQVVQASSDVEILLVGKGFNSNPSVSEMTVLSLEGEGECDCDLEVPSDIYDVDSSSECDDIINTTSSTDYSCIGKLKSMNLTGCGPCVLSLNVSYGSLSSGQFHFNVASVLGVYDTSTTQSVDRTSVTSVTISGEGFVSTNISDYEITILGGDSCLNVTSDDITFERISHQSIVTNDQLNLTSDCDTTLSASILYAPLDNIEVSSVTIATVLSVTTSTTTLVVSGNYNNFDIAGVGFITGTSVSYDFEFMCGTDDDDTDVSISIDEATFEVVSPTLIEINDLYIDAECTSNISVTITYENGTATSESTVVALVIGIDSTLETEYGLYSGTNSQDVTITGQNFDSTTMENGMTLLFYTDDCDDFTTEYSNLTVASSTLFIVHSVNVENCSGVVYANITLDSKDAGSYLIGTILSLNTTTLMGLHMSISEAVTISGQGFGTAKTMYACFTKYSNTTLDCSSGLNTYSYSNNNSTEIVFSSIDLSTSFDSSSDVYVAIGFASSDVDYSVFAMIGTLVSVTDQSSSVAISNSDIFDVTIKGTGFYLTDTDTYDFVLSTDDCTDVNIASITYVSSTELVLNSNVSDCTGVLSAILNYNSQGTLSAVSVGTILTLEDTSASSSVYTSSDSIVTLAASSTSEFANEDGTFSEYTVTFTDGEGCTNIEGTIDTESSSTSALVLTIDLSTCNEGNVLSATISVTNFPTDSTVTADIASFVVL